MKNIIVFGPAGAGKTTVADMITLGLNCRVITISQGNKIKEICGDLRYNSDHTNRELCQGVGQDMRRIFGPDVWCEYLLRKIDAIRQDNKTEKIIFIIDDGRQHNEYDFWINESFVAVGVVASLETRARRLLKRDGYDQVKQMGFENEITAEAIAKDKCKYMIHNEGTMDELREMVGQMIDMMEYAGKCCDAY